MGLGAIPKTPEVGKGGGPTQENDGDRFRAALRDQNHQGNQDNQDELGNAVPAAGKPQGAGGGDAPDAGADGKDGGPGGRQTGRPGDAEGNPRAEQEGNDPKPADDGADAAEPGRENGGPANGNKPAAPPGQVKKQGQGDRAEDDDPATARPRAVPQEGAPQRIAPAGPLAQPRQDAVAPRPGPGTGPGAVNNPIPQIQPEAAAPQQQFAGRDPFVVPRPGPVAQPATAQPAMGVHQYPHPRYIDQREAIRPPALAPVTAPANAQAARGDLGATPQRQIAEGMNNRGPLPLPARADAGPREMAAGPFMANARPAALTDGAPVSAPLLVLASEGAAEWRPPAPTNPTDRAAPPIHPVNNHTAAAFEAAKLQNGGNANAAVERGDVTARLQATTKPARTESPHLRVQEASVTNLAEAPRLSERVSGVAIADQALPTSQVVRATPNDAQRNNAGEPGLRDMARSAEQAGEDAADRRKMLDAAANGRAKNAEGASLSVGTERPAATLPAWPRAPEAPRDAASPTSSRELDSASDLAAFTPSPEAISPSAIETPLRFSPSEGATIERPVTDLSQPASEAPGFGNVNQIPPAGGIPFLARMELGSREQNGRPVLGGRPHTDGAAGRWSSLEREQPRHNGVPGLGGPRIRRKEDTSFASRWRSVLWRTRLRERFREFFSSIGRVLKFAFTAGHWLASGFGRLRSYFAPATPTRRDSSTVGRKGEAERTPKAPGRSLHSRQVHWGK